MDIENATPRQVLDNAKDRLLRSYQNSIAHCNGQAEAYRYIGDKRREAKYLAKVKAMESLKREVETGKIVVLFNKLAPALDKAS